VSARTDGWGLPDTTGQRPFLVAMLADTLGSGLFLPFSLLYFVVTTDLSLTAIGAGLTVANGLSVVTGPWFGGLVDRVGARPVSLGSNLLRAGGLVGYLFVHSWPSLVAAALLLSVGDRAFWASYGTLIGEIARPGERQRWFGLLTAVRNLGLGIGGLLGALLVTFGMAGAHAVVVGDAASYVLVALLMTRVRTSRQPGRREPVAGAWRIVLADRAYLALAVANGFLTTGWLVLTVVLPVYLVRTLHLPAWLPGTAFALNCVLIVLLQTAVVRRAERVRRTRSVALAGGLAVASMALFLGASPAPAALAVVLALAGTVVYSLGEIVYSPAADALAAEAAPDHLRGRYLSVWQLSWTASLTVGPVLAGSLLDLGAVPLWTTFGLLAATGAVAVLLVEPHLPADGVHGVPAVR